MFDILIVFLKELKKKFFLKKVNRQQKGEKIPSMQGVKCYLKEPITLTGDNNSTRPLVFTRMSNSSQSTHPVGRVLWEELLEEVMLHITPLSSLLHTLLKDKCMYLQDK